MQRRSEKQVPPSVIALLLLFILAIGLYQSHKQNEHPRPPKHAKDKTSKQTLRQAIPTPDPDADFWGQRFMWGDFRRNFPTEKAYNEYLEIISKVEIERNQTREQRERRASVWEPYVGSRYREAIEVLYQLQRILGTNAFLVDESLLQWRFFPELLQNSTSLNVGLLWDQISERSFEDVAFSISSSFARYDFDVIEKVQSDGLGGVIYCKKPAGKMIVADIGGLSSVPVSTVTEVAVNIFFYYTQNDKVWHSDWRLDGHSSHFEYSKFELVPWIHSDIDLSDSSNLIVSVPREADRYLTERYGLSANETYAYYRKNVKHMSWDGDCNWTELSPYVWMQDDFHFTELYGLNNLVETKESTVPSPFINKRPHWKYSIDWRNTLIDIFVEVVDLLLSEAGIRPFLHDESLLYLHINKCLFNLGSHKTVQLGVYRDEWNPSIIDSLSQREFRLVSLCSTPNFYRLYKLGVFVELSLYDTAEDTTEKYPTTFVWHTQLLAQKYPYALVYPPFDLVTRVVHGRKVFIPKDVPSFLQHTFGDLISAAERHLEEGRVAPLLFFGPLPFRTKDRLSYRRNVAHCKGLCDCWPDKCTVDCGSCFRPSRNQRDSSQSTSYSVAATPTCWCFSQQTPKSQLTL